MTVTKATKTNVKVAEKQTAVHEYMVPKPATSPKPSVDKLQLDPVLYSFMANQPLKPEAPEMTRMEVQKLFIQFAIENKLITDDSECYTISGNTGNAGVNYMFDKMFNNLASLSGLISLGNQG